MKQIVKDGKIDSSLFYVGKVGKYFWDRCSNKKLIEEALESILLKNVTQYSGCDGYIHNILEIYLFYTTRTIFDCLYRDYGEILSDEESDLIESDEYSNLIDKVLEKHYGKEYSIMEMSCFGKDGAMHSFNGSGCALLINPEDNEPVREDAPNIDETVAYMAKSYSNRKLIHKVNGIDIYMCY
jgi:hypothetical protein